MISLFAGTAWEPYAPRGRMEAIWRVVGALYHLGNATTVQVIAHTKLERAAARTALLLLTRQVPHDKRRRRLVRKKLLPTPGGKQGYRYVLTRLGTKLAKREWSAPKRLTELQYQVMKWSTTPGCDPYTLLTWLRGKPDGIDRLGVKTPRLSDIRFVYRKLLAANFINGDGSSRLTLTYSGRIRMLAKEAADERRNARPSRKRSPKRKRK